MLGTVELKREIELGNAGDPAWTAIIPAPDLANLKGASVDLHLGRWFSLPHEARTKFHDFAGDGEETRSKDYFVFFDNEFVLHPGRFVLAITLEWIRLPANRAAYVTGKSNIGRRGLVIETAPGVHPHFNGCLTLEMANLGEVPLVLRPGMKVCQLFLHYTSDCPEPKQSQFASQIKPTFGSNS